MNFRPLLLAAIATAACALSPSNARAAAAPGINPVADAFVNSNPTSNNAGSNYGAAGTLALSASALSKGEFDSFVRFNFGSTKTYFDGLYGAGNWTVQSVTLQLTTNSPNNALFNSPNTAGLFTITSLQSAQADAWAEGVGTPMTPDTTTPNAVNFSNRTTFFGSSDQSLGSYTFPATATANGVATTYTLNLANASGLLANVQSGSNTDLYFAAGDTTVSYLFNSTNFTTAASRPLLVVNAVPEPGSLAILGGALGLAALGFARSRRTRRV